MIVNMLKKDFSYQIYTFYGILIAGGTLYMTISLHHLYNFFKLTLVFGLILLIKGILNYCGKLHHSHDRSKVLNYLATIFGLAIGLSIITFIVATLVFLYS